MLNVKRKCGHEACGDLALVFAEFCWDHISNKDSYGEALIRASGENRDLAGCNLKKASLKG